MGITMIIVGIILISGGLFVLVRNEGPPISRPADQLDASPTSEEKGRKFEEWPVQRFRPSYFTLKEWRSDKYVAGVHAESSEFPDLEIEFRLRDRRSLFAVECKWRRAFEPGKKPGIEWATSRQIDTYQQFQRDRRIPVFVTIGIGGEPDHPGEIYVVPLDRLKYPFATAEYLAKFRKADAAADFFYDPEKLELK